MSTLAPEISTKPKNQYRGEELIQQFWQRVQQIPKPNNQDVLRILSELTGEEMGTMIANVDLQWAAEVLQRNMP